MNAPAKPKGLLPITTKPINISALLAERVRCATNCHQFMRPFNKDSYRSIFWICSVRYGTARTTDFMRRNPW